MGRTSGPYLATTISSILVGGFAIVAREMFEGIWVWKVLGLSKKYFGKLYVLRVMETEFPTFMGFWWVVNLASGGITILTTFLGRSFFKVSIALILT